VAELRPHLAKTRESRSVAYGIAAVEDCSFQSRESSLDGFVEGFQILQRRSVNELSQGFDVGLNCCSLILSKIFFEESGQQARGYQVEGAKFLPELSRLLVSPGDFAGLHENLIVQIADDLVELPVVFERDSADSIREGEKVGRVGVELDALVLRVGLEASSQQDRGQFGVEECQSFVRVHDCSWL